jgi:aspartyl-tRNA(Asn)/glutamyl-tRNA(Gln) amidotransferase subunit B
MRSKEEANDYRYFPDPDLLPVTIADERIARVEAGMPELPQAKRERFMREYALPAYDADILASSRALADYYDALVAATKAKPKIAANWVIGELTAALNREHREIEDSPVAAADLGALLERMENGPISGTLAKDLSAAHWPGPGPAERIIQERGLEQISDTASIDALVQTVLDANPEQAGQYRAGKTQVLGFLVGQVMKASQGKANPKQVNEALRRLLG